MMVAFATMNGHVSGEQYALGFASFFTVSLGGLSIGIICGLITALITRTTTEVRGLYYLLYIHRAIYSIDPVAMVLLLIRIASQKYPVHVIIPHRKEIVLNLFFFFSFFSVLSRRASGCLRNGLFLLSECRTLPLFWHYKVRQYLNFHYHYLNRNWIEPKTIIKMIYCYQLLQHHWLWSGSSALRIRQHFPQVFHHRQVFHQDVKQH